MESITFEIVVRTVVLTVAGFIVLAACALPIYLYLSVAAERVNAWLDAREARRADQQEDTIPALVEHGPLTETEARVEEKLAASDRRLNERYSNPPADLIARTEYLRNQAHKSLRH